MPSAVRVFGTVNGRPARLVVDTGSERTFVREDIVDAHGVPEATQLLSCVTGECTTMWGPVSVNMGVGDVMECLPVFMADLEDHACWDWTTSRGRGACVDLRRERIRVRNREVPLILGGDTQGVRGGAVQCGA